MIVPSSGWVSGDGIRCSIFYVVLEELGASIGEPGPNQVGKDVSFGIA